MRKKIAIFSLILLIFFLNMIFVYAENFKQIESKKIYEQQILNELNKKDRVRVIIRLEDYSNIKISITDPKEKRFKDYEQKKEYFKNLKSNILSNIQETEFKLTNDLIDGFAGEITKRGFEKLSKNPTVGVIYLDRIMHIALSESAPLINADDAWNLDPSVTGAGQTVCIIDSGIDFTNPDLTGKVVGQHCYCNTLNDDGFPCCPDNTGEDNNAMDDNGHGTHVAGIVAANGNVRGIAYGADLIAVKVLNASGSGWDGDIQSAIGWCIDNAQIFGISVISMSLGDGGEYLNNCPSGYDTEINLAHNLGITVIAASGNDAHTNGISYPACSPNVISVGAVYDDNLGSQTWRSCTDSTTQADKITCFSNRGNNLDVLAPGARIYSTVPGGHGNSAGTSMAAPHVAGVAALLLQTNPDLTPDEILNILKNTGKSIYDQNTTLTFPRVDAFAAVQSVCTCDNWQNQGCGIEGCSATQMRQFRVCYPLGCSVESRCVSTTSCETCSDGTLYGQCSTNKPKYCENGILVNKCISCGCPSSSICEADGSCTGCDSASYACSNAYLMNNGETKSSMCGDNQYYKIIIDKQYDVTWTITSSPNIDYDLYTSWNKNSCPSISNWNCAPLKGNGQTEICTARLDPGTYYAMVDKTSGEGTYSISVNLANPLDCECISGPCCDGCHYYGTDKLCYVGSGELGCPYGTGCGAYTGYHDFVQYCSGTSNDCNGLTNFSQWYITGQCGEFERCVNGNCVYDVECEACTNPTTGMDITTDTKLCPGSYNVDNIEILANNIVLDCNDATLVGTGANNGIIVSGSDSVTIKNCNLQNHNKGINLAGTANGNKIHNNTFNNNQIGLYMYDSRYNEIYDNTFSGNTQYAISLNYGVENKIGKNNLYNTGISDVSGSNNEYCLYCVGNRYYNGATGPSCSKEIFNGETITNNRKLGSECIFNLPDGIAIGANNVVFNCNNAKFVGDKTGGKKGIYLNNKNGLIIKNCNISNYDYGIYLDSSSGNLISNNYLESNNNGISLQLSENNELSENSVINNVIGLDLMNSNNNNVLYNKINVNNDGINIYDSKYNNIYQNNLSQNIEYAISLYKTDENRIGNNDIYNTGILEIFPIGEILGKNEYCLNGLGNKYYEGATGPGCKPPKNCFLETFETTAYKSSETTADWNTAEKKLGIVHIKVEESGDNAHLVGKNNVNEWHRAQSFRLLEDFTLNSVSFKIYAVNGNPSNLWAQIRADDNGYPSNTVLMENYITDKTAGWKTVSITPIALSKNIKYHLVLITDLQRNGGHEATGNSYWWNDNHASNFGIGYQCLYQYSDWRWYCGTETDGQDYAFYLNGHYKGEAYSTTIFPQNVTKATLMPIDLKLGTSTITYYTSADNGNNWEEVNDGVEHTFVNQGSGLRWRAKLESDDININTYVRSVYVCYDYKRIPSNINFILAQGVGTGISSNYKITYTIIPQPVSYSIGSNYRIYLGYPIYIE